MTRSISFLMLSDSSLPASSILFEASRSSSKPRLISNYGRLVIRNLSRDADDEVRRERQKSFRASISACCSCSRRLFHQYSYRVIITQTAIDVCHQIANLHRREERRRSGSRPACLPDRTVIDSNPWAVVTSELEMFSQLFRRYANESAIDQSTRTMERQGA